MITCVLSLVAGLAVAAFVPVGQFALGLLTIALAGGGVALVQGQPAGTVVLHTLLLYVCAQVGYGIGHVALALREPRGAEPEASRAAPLREPLLK